MDVRGLQSRLIEIEGKTISENDFFEIIQFSRSIVQAYLRSLRYTIVKLCSGHGMSETDLAYDCIAEVFSRNQSGDYSLVKNFLASLNHDAESLPPEEIFLAYKSFLIRIADAQLARLYAQVDPAGSRIHRNLRDCLNRSELFTLQRDFRGIVVYPINGDSHDHFTAFPLDMLQQEFFNRARRDNSTAQMITALYDILISQENYRRSVPLIDVVQMFKKVFQSDLEYEIEVESSPLGTLSSEDVEHIRLDVENALKEKIIVTYYTKGKIDKKEAEALWLACKDLISDWCKPECKDLSLFGYFSRYYPVDMRAYENSYRIKMEYLLKLARKEFAARLNDDI